MAFRSDLCNTVGILPPRRLGTAIRNLRQALRLTQEELAKQVGVTQGCGLKKNPSLPTLKKLARALGVPVTELLE